MWSNWVGKFQKGACRYLLQRYIGQYLKEKLTVDQLTVDLYNGTGSVTNVSLDCDALNALAEQHHLPIEFIDGTLENISFSVPWSTIMQESCEIEINGLQIAIQPKNRIDNGSSMLDSMFTSMASSMQLAEECLKITENIEDDQEDLTNQEPLSGLEHCAKTIDAVLSRVKICFRDTVVRIEKCQRGSDVGVALEFHIKLWRYSDDSCQEDSTTVLDSAFSHKKITLEGVTCFSDVFSSKRYFDKKEMPESFQKYKEDSNEQDNTVLIGKFAGRHELRIQVKMDDSISGAQISVDCNFGSVIALLSPIQAHILYTLVDEILNPESYSSGGAVDMRSCKEKPMDNFDWKRVEEELQERQKPGVIGIPGLTQQQGWSSACYDDSDDEFLPLKAKSAMCNSSASNFMNASVTSMASSMQSLTDSLSSSTIKSTYNFASGGNGAMLSIEKTNFSISFASVSVILLHEDILTLSSLDAVLPASLQQMKECSKNFFQSLNMFGATVKGEKDVQDVRQKMNAACDRSHHRLIAAPLKVKGSVTGSNNTTETTGQLTLGYCELIESLKDNTAMAGTPNPECIEVLSFPRNFEHGNMHSMKLDFKTENRKGRMASASKTALKFHLQECHAELDISIVDRINSLLNSTLPHYMETKSEHLRHQVQYNSTFNHPSQSLIKISVKCTSFNLNFRFPIPDLRPVDDPNRVPYWIRNLQNDSIIVQLNKLDFLTVLHSAGNILEFDTKCQEARLLYKKSPTEEPILFATALADDPELDGASLRSQGLDWPRILVWKYPEFSSESAVETEVSDDGDNMDTLNFMSMPNRKPSPFSSKRVVHETLNSQEDNDNNSHASESVIPGDRIEMSEFAEATKRNVLYKVELYLRFVEVSFHSKHLFEEIYNRVLNDWLLWEPCRVQSNFETSQIGVKPKQQAFSMCKSAIRLDPESDSEEEMTAFYTPSATTSGVGPKSSEFKSRKKKCLGFGQSEVTFDLSINKGIISFYTPFQDISGNTVPGQKGQLTIKVEQGNLFVVSSYKGDPNLGYLSVICHKAEMLHADFIRSKDVLPGLCSELIKTIYPSDDGVIPNRNSDSSVTDGKDMLSVAIKIERDQSKNVKTFKVATGIREGTLNHMIYLPNRSWFTQLIDFFDVTDNPVIGYTPSSVLTELHLHLWNCAVDYKPLNLPLRSILTMETFSISSNIAAQTSTSVIRFMSEDAAFFLSSNVNSNNLFNDYVCVMEMDFFELSLRLCAKRNSAAPRSELTASGNVIHIRTCSDSFKALLELLAYYNNEGDLVDPTNLQQQPEKESETIPYSPIKASSSEPALITTEEVPAENRMSASQTEHVHDLVTEAMQEAAFGATKQSSAKHQELHFKSNAQMFDLHFSPNSFNNEDFQPEESTSSTPLPGDPIMESTNGYPIEIHMSDEDEEEFCILENDPGVGIISKNGEPEARVLSDEPIRLIEDHFAPPVGKMDILKAPKHYPNPVTKYALKELTIIWHLYGGEDFGTSPSRRSSGKTEEHNGSCETLQTDSWKDHHQMYYEPSEVDIAVDALNPGVFFSKTKAFESPWEEYDCPTKNPQKQYPEGCTSWRQQGGKGRRHEILVELHLSKIKFVHEVYPETTEQASRQVIVIKNVEILDKLRTSQLNKMLYLYTSPTRPKQTHANMVMIKAAHIRPDAQLNIEECCLKISILPIRLNIDQDALLFIHQYFADLSLKSDLEVDEDLMPGRFKSNPPSHTPSVESLPVMTVNVGEGDGSVSNDSEDTSNLLIFNDDPFGMQEDNASICSKDPSIDSTKPPSPVYFRQVIFSPEVPIRLDYRAKRFDMTHGPLAGVLMGLAQLNCSEIRLKRISHRHGILGIDRLVAFLISEWAGDIKKNQLPSLLGGVGPMHSFVQLFQGVRDLFWLPIEQYQKDGRIAKGLQRGVNAFSTSTAMAALELTNKLIQTIQGAAEFTYDMVSPGPSVQQKRRQSSSKRRKRYNQPGDIREGMTNAYNVVREGLGDTAHTIVLVASKEHEQKGISGAVGGVLRQIPPTIVRPIILVAEASSNVLDGVMSQVKPEFKKENEEKWKET